MANKAKAPISINMAMIESNVMLLKQDTRLLDDSKHFIAIYTLNSDATGYIIWGETKACLVTIE